MSIWEVHEGKVRVYSGNYSEYIKQKQIEKEQQSQAHEQYIREKNRLEKAAQEKMKKAEKIVQAGNVNKKESKAKANRMFETKSKATSQKAIQRAAKAIEHRMERLQEVAAVQEEKKILNNYITSFVIEEYRYREFLNKMVTPSPIKGLPFDISNMDMNKEFQFGLEVLLEGFKSKIK